MTPAQQSRREALAKRVYGMCWPQEAGWPTWCVAHEVAQRRAESVADFIIAEQERREVPLRCWIESARRLFMQIAGMNDAVLSQFDPKLRREWWQKAAIEGVREMEQAQEWYRALDAPPVRTLEHIAADLKDWRKMPCTSVDALMDELAAALARESGKE